VRFIHNYGYFLLNGGWGGIRHAKKLPALFTVILIVCFSVCHAGNIGKATVEETTACSDETLSLNVAPGARKIFYQSVCDCFIRAK